MLLLVWTGISCTGERMQTRESRESRPTQLENSPMVEGEIAPPDHIKSVQVYRGADKTSLPAIELGTDDYITLRFDELGESARMFRVRVRHRNADWSPSPLMRHFYLGGYSEDLISGGSPSAVQRPDYTHYHYRFPNENMHVRMSGNYLLEVLEYETSRRLFSVPFFVYENEGRISTEIETLYGLDTRYRVHHQPFARYQYPSYVISPVMDLKSYFVQNRFWGRARKADAGDVAEYGIFRTYLTRPHAFVGVYEFRPLSLPRYDDPGPDVVDIRPETIPPRIQLYRDVVNLDVNPRRRTPSTHGLPRDDNRARYVDVRFELQLPPFEETELPIYVYGPFNNWTIREQNRMEYQETTNSYTGRAVIKEGDYDYKYAIVDRGRVDDLRLDASFATTEQEYTTLVYFQDSQYRADRLLQIQNRYTR